MRHFRSLFAALTALVLTACGGGSVQSPDFTSELVSVRVAPLAITTAAGRTVQYSAVGQFTKPPNSVPEFDERPLDPAGVTWTVSNTTVASVDANGLVTTLVPGTTQVRATSRGVGTRNPGVLTVTAAILESITIDPPQATVSLGNSQTFSARGVFSNGTTVPTSVNWTSSNTAVATITPASGISTTATSLSQGGTVITASTTNSAGDTITATAPLTVGAFVPTLISIAVTPDPASRPVGLMQQFVATGTFTTAPGSPNQSTTMPVTNVLWTVVNASGESSTPVAIIDSDDGIAIGQRVGRAIVTAASGNISDSADFNVTAPILTAINVTPQNPTIPLGGTRVLTATAVFSDGATGPISVTWTSTNPAVVSVSPSSGTTTTATAEAVGSTTVTATSDGISGDTTVTVGAASLQTLLRVDPLVARVTPGRTVEFTAIGSFSDGTEAPINDSSVTWTSSAPSIATIDANGVATGLIMGQTTITASLNSDPTDTNTATLNVTGQVCTTPLLASDGAIVTTDTTPLCLLCSVEDPVRIINASPIDFGRIIVPVALTGAEASVRIRGVDNPSYEVPFAAGNNAGFIVGRPPGSLVLAELASQLVIRTYLNGVQQQTSSDGVTVLRLELLGLELTGDQEAGLVSIITNAPYDAIELSFNSGVASALSNVNVFQACATAEAPQPLAALRGVARIVPNATALRVGATQNLVAIGDFNNNTEAPIPDSDIDWTSSNDGLVTVSPTGLITGVATGTATITATLKTAVVTPPGAVRSAVATVTVVADLCETPLRASNGAFVTRNVDGICVGCSAINILNVIDDVTTNFSTIAVPLALLNGRVSITATAAVTDEFPGGDNAGFLITRPTGRILIAEVLAQIEVSTLLDGQVQETTSPNIPLRADLLGLELLGGQGDAALITIPTSEPYDALRLTFKSGLLTAGLQNGLSNVNVFQACATASLPPAPPPP
ncbi:MAG: Ig-like domain-containing protein [Panacagrimonas sp.]